MSTSPARRARRAHLAVEHLAKVAEQATKQANVDLLCAVGKVNGALEQLGPKRSQGRSILQSVRHYLQDDPSYAGTVAYTFTKQSPIGTHTAEFFGPEEPVLTPAEQANAQGIADRLGAVLLAPPQQ